MLLTPFNADATDEKTQSFVTKYKEQFGETPEPVRGGRLRLHLCVQGSH